jgi:hypothetical protein
MKPVGEDVVPGGSPVESPTREACWSVRQLPISRSTAPLEPALHLPAVAVQNKPPINLVVLGTASDVCVSSHLALTAHLTWAENRHL